SGLQEVEQFGPIRIREANKVPHDMPHPWNGGKKSISAPLAEVLLCRPRFMHYRGALVKCLRQVNRRLSLMTHFAKHGLTTGRSGNGCGSHSCRIGALPELATAAAGLRHSRAPEF